MSLRLPHLHLVCMMLTCGSAMAQNDRPILGVLAQEASQPSPGDTYIPSTYVKWIESAGARVVPVRLNESLDYYRTMFRSINGILFPDGDVSLLDSAYAKAGRTVYKMAIQASDNGDYFPMWGTCLGFDLLTAITSGRNILSHVSVKNLQLPLNFTEVANKNRLYGNVPTDVLQYLRTENVTTNYHQWGLTPKNYSSDYVLRRFYKVMSTNVDSNGEQFISSIEAKNYPIYGIQFHPEDNNYVWNVKYNLNHGSHGVRVSQYFADFLVSEARKSIHKFPDIQSEIDAMIYNYHPIFSRKGDFELTYFFNYTRT